MLVAQPLCPGKIGGGSVNSKRSRECILADARGTDAQGRLTAPARLFTVDSNRRAREPTVSTNSLSQALALVHIPLNMPAAEFANLSMEHREQQKTYWTDHSVEATVEAMMLDSQAATIDKEERPEVGTVQALFFACLRLRALFLEKTLAHSIS